MNRSHDDAGDGSASESANKEIDKQIAQMEKSIQEFEQSALGNSDLFKRSTQSGSPFSLIEGRHQSDPYKLLEPAKPDPCSSFFNDPANGDQSSITNEDVAQAAMVISAGLITLAVTAAVAPAVAAAVIIPLTGATEATALTLAAGFVAAVTEPVVEEGVNDVGVWFGTTCDPENGLRFFESPQMKEAARRWQLAKEVASLPENIKDIVKITRPLP
jgi:hypothetical protein